MTNCTQGVNIPVSGHVTPNPNSHHVHYSFDHLQVICIYTPSVKFQHSSHVRYSFDHLQVICIYTPSIKFQHKEASPDLLLQNIVLHAFYTNAYTPPTQTSTHVGASLVASACMFEVSLNFFEVVATQSIFFITYDATRSGYIICMYLIGIHHCYYYRKEK